MRKPGNETSHFEQNGTHAKKRLSRLFFVERATLLNAPESCLLFAIRKLFAGIWRVEFVTAHFLRFPLERYRESLPQFGRERSGLYDRNRFSLM